jgi:hypothetical protein
MMPEPKPLQVVSIPPPPSPQHGRRAAVFTQEGEKKTRYHLPNGLDSSSPVGYRQRVPLTRREAEQGLALLSLQAPEGFVTPDPVTEAELFEEAALGLLRARQSTNFRGQRQVTFGPERSAEIAELLRGLDGLDGPVLDRAAYTHVFVSRPYRTPFTLLLTFVGHKPIRSLVTVPMRAWRKRYQHTDDIPTIGYLPMLHLGILAEAVEKAPLVASNGKRAANILQAPFCAPHKGANQAGLQRLEAMCGLSSTDRAAGWRVALVAQVGQLAQPLDLPRETCRKLGANLLSFRSERIQPGVNAEDSAPPAYQRRQEMDVPEALVIQAGRAAYNAFARWTGLSREEAKRLLLMDRIDVLTPNGKERLRALRQELSDITDRVVEDLPKWADLPMGRALSRNAGRGRKAFALAGQRIYVGGLSAPEISAAGIPWELSIRAVGAAAARSGLICELMGCVDLPESCDMLAGLCLMAGPVNQNDIGKSFYGFPDLLAQTYPNRDPTAMLVWTLKAKTVCDPIGNEEQLLNPERKGALVDLRPGPHEVIQVEQGGTLRPMRERQGQHNSERAFSDVGNFVTAPDGTGIPGNRGAPWPEPWRSEVMW